MRPAPVKSLFPMIAVFFLCLPGKADAQMNAREILSDHSANLQAGDLSIRFIYLNTDSLGRAVAKQVLTSEEYAHFEKERARLPRKWSILALRLRPFRDARFDPTQIKLTDRENTHQVGFMDLVDVGGLFLSTVKRGDYVFGFIKVRDIIDFRRPITFEYESYKTTFQLPTKWRQRYFQFIDPAGE